MSCASSASVVAAVIVLRVVGVVVVIGVSGITGRLVGVGLMRLRNSRRASDSVLRWRMRVFRYRGLRCTKGAACVCCVRGEALEPETGCSLRFLLRSGTQLHHRAVQKFILHCDALRLQARRINGRIEQARCSLSDHCSAARASSPRAPRRRRRSRWSAAACQEEAWAGTTPSRFWMETCRPPL